MIDRYKKIYGDEKVEILDNGRMTVPGWLFWALVHKSGLKSRKNRLLKKRVKQELHKAILRGIERMG